MDKAAEASFHPDHPEVIRIILPPGRCTKRLLNISDIFLSLFVITPLVVAHWRGTWALMDRIPEQFPPAICFLFGCALHTSFVLIKELLHMEFTERRSGYKSVRRIVSQNVAVKIYTYVFSMGCNMNWKGGFMGLDLIFGFEVSRAIIPSIIALMALVVLKCVRNLAAPPIFVALDNKDMAFSFPTRFRFKILQFFEDPPPDKRLIMREGATECPHHNRKPAKHSGNPCHSALLKLLDILISSTIVGPSVIAYWRGTWNLCDHYLIPDNDLYSASASLGIGVGGNLLFTLFQRIFRNNFHPHKYRLTFYFVSRSYTYIFGAVCVNGWRGPWALTDIFTGFNLYVVITITSLAIVFLAFIKGLRNLCAAPFLISTDGHVDYFQVTTMFKTSGTHEPGLYVLDCVFSVLVVGTLVVVAWRGVWVFLDLMLYPDNPTYSAWGSLMIGYGIVAVTFALQPIMRWTCDRLTGFWRIAVADVFLLLSFVGTINVWRGVWQLLDIYFLPENRLLSDWLTHGLSFVLLALLNCSNSVLVRGVYIDAEEPAGQCVIFPIHYIRLFFQKERTKKQKRLFDALERQDQNNAMYLLDKSQTNNIRIVKSNAGILGGPEIKPMLTLETEKPKNGTEQTAFRG